MLIIHTKSLTKKEPKEFNELLVQNLVSLPHNSTLQDPRIINVIAYNNHVNSSSIARSPHIYGDYNPT